MRGTTAICGGKYERKVSNVVELQQEISRDVSQRLRSQEDGVERIQLGRNYVPNAEAYRLYLQGRYNWYQRTADGLQKAIEYFGQAIVIDQNYGLAYAGQADCYVLLNVYNVAPAAEVYEKAQAAASKALAIDETLAEAHASLAFVTYRYKWKWAEAEQHFKRAIALNPNYATAHQWYAAYLAATGRHNDAIAEAKRAHELEPFSLTIHSDLVRHLYYALQLDEAREECLKLLEMDRQFARGHLELGQILEQKGMYDAAIVEFREALSLSPNSLVALTALGHAQGLSGKKSEALKVIARLNELSKQQYVSPYQTTVIYAGLGDSRAREGTRRTVQLDTVHSNRSCI